MLYSQAKTVVLREFDNLIDAQVAVDILRQNNIKCFMSNEIGSQLYPIFSSSIAGVRVNVFEGDLETAQDLLDTFLKEN